MKIFKLIHNITGGIALAVLAGVLYSSSIKPMLEQRVLNSEVKIIKNAIEMYYSEYNVLPKSLGFLVGAPKFVLSDKPIKLSEWEYSVYMDNIPDGYFLSHPHLNSKL